MVRKMSIARFAILLLFTFAAPLMAQDADKAQALEGIRKLCTGGFGTLAQGERATIKYKDSSLEINSGNEVFVSNEAGVIKVEDITFDEYTKCLQQFIEILGLEKEQHSLIFKMKNLDVDFQIADQQSMEEFNAASESMSIDVTVDGTYLSTFSLTQLSDISTRVAPGQRAIDVAFNLQWTDGSSSTDSCTSFVDVTSDLSVAPVMTIAIGFRKFGIFNCSFREI